MKKLYLLLVSSFLCVQLFAQEAEPSKVRLGFKAQPIFSWMSFETKNVSSDGMRVGGKFGLMTDVRLGKNYAFATGLDFLMTGGHAAISDSVYKINQVSFGNDTIYLRSRGYKFQYLEIPLTLKMKTNQIGYFTYFIQLGGAIGFNISAKADDAGVSSKGIDNLETVKLKAGLGSGSEVKLIRTEVNVGIGTEWAIQGNLSLVVGASFHKGLTNVFNGKNANLTEQYRSGAGVVNNQIAQKSSANYVSLNIGLLF